MAPLEPDPSNRNHRIRHSRRGPRHRPHDDDNNNNRHIFAARDLTFDGGGTSDHGTQGVYHAASRGRMEGDGRERDVSLQRVSQ